MKYEMVRKISGYFVFSEKTKQFEISTGLGTEIKKRKRKKKPTSVEKQT